VVEQDASFLRYLTECGLLLDAEGELVENRPEAGALSVRVDNHPIVLGLEAAAKVLTHPAISTADRTAG
jgi:DtxR family Mn-dependent transcriptional regulator